MNHIEVIEEIIEHNILLRKITVSDAQYFYDSLKEEIITKFLSLDQPRSLNHSKKIINKYINYWDNFIQFNYIIELKENNCIKKIGSISLWNISWIHKRAEIGIWIKSKFWNKGYGKKAISLIKKIGFIHLKLNRLEAHIAINNKRSINLFKKCGFIEEGVLKKYLYLKGKFHDAIILACLSDFNIELPIIPK
ncbi:MAG: GNAT family N-acetyltransferase [Promethearchaeota archaeon]